MKWQIAAVSTSIFQFRAHLSGRFNRLDNLLDNFRVKCSITMKRYYNARLLFEIYAVAAFAPNQFETRL